MKIEKTTTANKPFLNSKIVATNTGCRRIRGLVLSSVSTKFGFLFAVSAILLLPSLLVIPINQSAWAGTFPGPNGQIAFSSNRDGNFEIYTMSEDGSDVTRLTEDDEDDREPDWGTNTSPPGDDDGKNKHDDKEKRHGDNAKKKHYPLLWASKKTGKLS
jgi:hypothetical protein